MFLLKFLVNKRLDEWVGKDRLDLTKVQLPKKEVKTPLKEIKNGSRPCSPEREIIVSFGYGDLSNSLCVYY